MHPNLSCPPPPITVYKWNNVTVFLCCKLCGRIGFFFCLRTILRADRADEGSEGTRLRGSHTVSWWQAGLGHLDQEAVWCGGLKSSAGPHLLQTFRGVTFQPAGSPVCPYFSLPDMISSGPQHLCGKNLRDTRSSGARTLALAVLTGGPSQPPLDGWLTPPRAVPLWGATLPRRSLQTLVQTSPSLCCLSICPHFAQGDPTHSLTRSFVQQIPVSLVWIVPRSAIPSAQLDSYDAWEAGTCQRFSILFLALQHISQGTHKQNPSEYIHQIGSASG